MPGQGSRLHGSGGGVVGLSGQQLISSTEAAELESFLQKTSAGLMPKNNKTIRKAYSTCSF